MSTKAEILAMMHAPDSAEWADGIAGPGPGPVTFGTGCSGWEPTGANGLGMIAADTKGRLYWDAADGWQIKDSGERYQNPVFEEEAEQVDMAALAVARKVADAPAKPANPPPTATAVSGTPAPVALAPEPAPAPSPTAAVVAANSPAAIVAANPAPVVSVHQHPHTGGFIVTVQHVAGEVEQFVVRSFEEVKAKIESIYRAHFRANPTK